MSKKRDVTVKSLSSNLLQMKFMKKSVISAQEQDDEETHRNDSDHWVILQLKKQTEVDMSPNFSICENLNYGRMSFKGFNPAIERIMKLMRGEEVEEENSKQKIEDEEFAEEYASVANIAHKFTKKRRRNESQKPDRFKAKKRKQEEQVE